MAALALAAAVALLSVAATCPLLLGDPAVECREVGWSSGMGLLPLLFDTAGGLLSSCCSSRDTLSMWLACASCSLSASACGSASSVKPLGSFKSTCSREFETDVLASLRQGSSISGGSASATRWPQWGITLRSALIKFVRLHEGPANTVQHNIELQKVVVFSHDDTYLVLSPVSLVRAHVDLRGGGTSAHAPFELLQVSAF